MRSLGKGWPEIAQTILQSHTIPGHSINAIRHSNPTYHCDLMNYSGFPRDYELEFEHFTFAIEDV